jgi:hypothetical protein
MTSEKEDSVTIKPASIAASSACIWVYNAATALYHAPSNLSGLHGMKHKWIRCTSNWRGCGHKEDCVPVDVDSGNAPGGLQAACIKLFFLLKYGKILDKCALMQWYTDHLDHPDPDTGMRMVLPSS